MNTTNTPCGTPRRRSLLGIALGLVILLGADCGGAGSTTSEVAADPPPAEAPPIDHEGPVRAAGPVEIAIADPSSWHVHAPGTPFTVRIVASGPGVEGTYVHARWVDADGAAISEPVRIPGGGGVTLSSPGGEIGYYGLVFSSEGSDVAFPPQAPGFPSMEYGFAILPRADSARVHDPSSYFGLVHCSVEVEDEWDPYLRGHHSKTMSWRSTSAKWWNFEIARRTSSGMSELPLVSGDAWVTKDDTPVSTAALDALGAKFSGLAAVSPAGLDWELGREENRHGRYDTTSYFSNLTAKVRRVRAILAKQPAPGRLVYNFEGFHYEDLEKLLSSAAIREFDVLSLHPYRWKEFPSPESWLPGHVAKVREMLDAHSLSDLEIWITETGVPVRGTTDPDGFFGYPESGSEVPGATRDYAACYLLKLHVLAIAEGVGRVYLYNYQNRGNDPTFAEHHFGLRSYAAEKRAPGFPLPSYVACMTMLDELYRKRFVAAREPSADARVFEFTEKGGADVTIVAWALPGKSVPLSWSALRPGLEAEAVVSLKDVYGTPRSIPVSGVTLDDRPVWVTVRAP